MAFIIIMFGPFDKYHRIPNLPSHHSHSSSSSSSSSLSLSPQIPTQRAMVVSGPEKVEAKGGKGGKEWDDGADHDGVRRIAIGGGLRGIPYVRFDYDKSGQLIGAGAHGYTTITVIGTDVYSPSHPYFVIGHPDEYLESVVGYYEGDSIQGLQFKTNKKESQVYGYAKGTKFTLAVKDKKIVGFHGFADTTLNSLGAYFAPISSSPSSSVNKLEAQGGKGETTFDDRTFDGVRKVYVGQGDSGITYVKFEYDNGGKPETRDHGKEGMLGAEEFKLQTDEYITSVEGYYDKIYGSNEAVISALIFTTSKGRTSQQFGIAAGTKFVLDGQGRKLVGFHGSFGNVLHSLGAYFSA